VLIRWQACACTSTEGFTAAHGPTGVTGGADVARNRPLHSQASEAAFSLPSLSTVPLLQLSQVLAAAVQDGVNPTAVWQAGVLDLIHEQLPTLSEEEMPTLAALVWAVSELGCTPAQPWLHTVAAKVQQGIESGSFLAPDFCQLVAALGSMGYKPDAQWTAALMKEVQLQLAEFLSDFNATDVARMASGVADMGLAPIMFATEDLNRLFMKAAYSKTKTIEDKAAVDFALAKLSADERSMHYDPRWTHEELSWLPRNERDKRRLIKENWVPSQWGGY